MRTLAILAAAVLMACGSDAVAPACQPLSLRCSGDHDVQACDLSGSEWITVESCGLETWCSEAAIDCGASGSACCCLSRTF